MSPIWVQLPKNSTRSPSLAISRWLNAFNAVESSFIAFVDKRAGHSSSWGQKTIYWVTKGLLIVMGAILKVVGAVFAITWSAIATSTMLGGTMLLLTDGTVIINESVALGGIVQGARRWWKLTPDNKGDYSNGSWLRIADSHIARKYFASAVLSDGRVIVCGGEYSDGSGAMRADESNRCEVYDPVSNIWTELDTPPITSQLSVLPARWSRIGDAPCAVLPDGRFMLASMDTVSYTDATGEQRAGSRTAAFNPLTNTWDINTGHMLRSSLEESWVLMPDGSLVAPQCIDHPNAERYLVDKNLWKFEGTLPVDIVEFGPKNNFQDSSFEVGPGVLLTDGRAFFVGATGNTVFYQISTQSAETGIWTAGPAIPSTQGKKLGCKDGPCCLMVNGHVLVVGAPITGKVKDYLPPCYFFDFNGTDFVQIVAPPNSNCPAYVGRMLLLPTGEVAWAREGNDGIYILQSNAEPQANFRPKINECPNSFVPGSVISISGTQFNGLSQAVGYGDDASAATNYPLVRLRNKANGDIRYCRTFDHSSMGVATGDAVVTTHVHVPEDLPSDAYDLFVVANGIESSPKLVVVEKHL